MEKAIISTTKAPAAIGPYSQAVVGNGTLYVSGQLPIDPDTGVMPEDLKAQVAQLESQLADAQDQLDVLPDIISHQEYVLEQTCQALDYFWQVNEAYVRGRYSLCRELMAVMEDTSNGQTPLKDYLPTQSTTNNDRFSPADRYQEIYDDLY